MQVLGGEREIGGGREELGRESEKLWEGGRGRGRFHLCELSVEDRKEDTLFEVRKYLEVWYYSFSYILCTLSRTFGTS